jgi:hypothetical protein
VPSSKVVVPPLVAQENSSVCLVRSRDVVGGRAEPAG